MGMPAAAQTDSPPARISPDDLQRQLVERHADHRQREDRPAAHGIDVGNRVGRGDAAEIERIVDDGREEIGGGDDGLLVVELVHRRVVAGFDADQQILRAWLRSGVFGQKFGQHGRRDFAAAAAAVGELRSV